MDRDHARGFVQQVLKKEEEFLEELKAFQEKMESVDHWDSVSRDFAPRVKAFYNAQLEQWQRYYLGLDGTDACSLSCPSTSPPLCSGQHEIRIQCHAHGAEEGEKSGGGHDSALRFWRTETKVPAYRMGGCLRFSLNGM